VDDLIKRVLSSILLLSFVLTVIYAAPLWLFCVVIVAFVATGQYEFFRMVANRGIFVYRYFGIVAGAFVPVLVFLADGRSSLSSLQPFLIVVASLVTLTLQFSRRDNARDHLISTALTLFSLLYVAWFFSFLIKLRTLENGANLVAFLVLVTKISDMGAYAIGRLIGRRELIPRISPRKTKEGTAGGVVVSMITAYIAGIFMTGYSPFHLICIGGVLAVIGQTGDLAESLIKRDCNVKDSGGYFAGIGGVLDLIDSLIFTAPVFYFYIVYSGMLS
jgi:phosphatidate cytidylyltransferase